MVDSIAQQTEAFLKGFQTIIPRKALIPFNERDINLKLTGISYIDGYDFFLKKKKKILFKYF